MAYEPNRDDIDLTNLFVDRWRPCEKCVIRNPSCDDCKSMWTAQRWDEENIERARIHERVEVNLTNEEDDTDDDEYWEEVEAQEMADADAELDDSDSDDQSVRVMTEEEVQSDPRMSAEAARAILRVEPPEGEHDVVLLDNRHKMEGWDTPKEMFRMMRTKGLHTCKHFAGACIPCAFKVNTTPL